MQSMTGFGQAALQDVAGSASVQIASVNQKGCRVSLRSDSRDLALEERLRQRVQEVLQRGSVTVQVQLRPPVAGSVDFDAAAALWRELAAQARALGAPPPTLADALRLLPQAGPSGPDQPLQELCLQALEQALADCLQMRRQEGAALAAALATQAADLHRLLVSMRQLAAGRVHTYRDRLQARLQELLSDRQQPGPELIARELAIYADRIDVREEMDRLTSHLQQLDNLIARDSGQGKTLEFLLQEIGREINTTGAKAADADLQQVVVEAKTVLEQMKEQAANVL